MAERKNEYRRLARECFSLAQTTSGEESRLTLIEMARVWTRLADEQDVAFPLAGVVGPHPVVQQQQQVPAQKGRWHRRGDSRGSSCSERPWLGVMVMLAAVLCTASGNRAARAP